MKNQRGEKVIYIRKVEDLDKIRELDQNIYHTVYLIIKNNIDFQLKNFKPIDAGNMKVVIKGNNHMFRDLTISNEDKLDTGLFSRTKDFEIYDLRVYTSIIHGSSCVGALVGTVDGNAIVKNVQLLGRIIGESHCGGLFGTVNVLRIEDSIASTSMEGIDVVGGVVGLSNKVIMRNLSTPVQLDHIPGKAQGKVSGYNSEDYADRDLRLVAIAMQHLPIECPHEEMKKLELMCKQQ